MDYAYVGLMLGFGLLSFGFIKLAEKLMESEE